MRTLIMLMCLCVGGLCLLPLPGRAASEKGPDLVNTLGVGARSIAMGGAFTAIADDASASFWNPARLGELPYFQAMIQGRDVLRITQTKTDVPEGLVGQVPAGEIPDYWDADNTETAGLSTLPMKLSFLGFAKPMGDYEPSIGSAKGTWGLSYTLGGYFDYRTRYVGYQQYETDGTPPQMETIKSLDQEDRLVENHYLTLAWGKNFLIAARPPRAREAAAPAPLATTPLLDSPNTEFVAGSEARKAEIEAVAKVTPGDYPLPSSTIKMTDEIKAPVRTPSTVRERQLADSAAPRQKVSAPARTSTRKPVDPNKLPLYKVGVGVGIFEVMQSQSKRFAQAAINLHDLNNPNDDVIESEDVFPTLNSTGQGFGYIVGFTGELWGYKTPDGRQMLPPGGRWRVGATYRSKAEVGGLEVKMPGEDLDMGDQFGREVPARMTAGIAYEYTEPEESVAKSTTIRAPKQFTCSAEIQRFSIANDVNYAIDRRKAVSNLHLGVEYIPTRQWLPIPFLPRLTEDQAKLAYVEPIRLGLRTNKVGNVNDIFEDDTVLSGGFAVYYSQISGGARGMYDFSLEPTVEYLLNTRQTIITVTSSYRF